MPLGKLKFPLILLIYNHCNVPYRWEDNKPLANWVFRQREHRKAGKLTAEREKKLTAIGFVWGSTAAVSKDDRWDQRIRELAEYRKAYLIQKSFIYHYGVYINTFY